MANDVRVSSTASLCSLRRLDSGTNRTASVVRLEARQLTPRAPWLSYARDSIGLAFSSFVLGAAGFIKPDELQNRGLPPDYQPPTVILVMRVRRVSCRKASLYPSNERH